MVMSPKLSTAADIIAAAAEAFGRVDILVNNAADQMTRGSLDEIPDEE